MSPLRIESHSNRDAAFLGAVKETFDLGADVEFVLAAVTDEEIELPIAQVVLIHDFNGIELTQFCHGVGAPANERAVEIAKANLDQRLRPPDHFAGLELFAPAPATRIKR